VTAQDEVGRLQHALAELALDAPAGEGCATPERIWAAARGELPTDESKALLDHAALCPHCALAWRLAHEVATEAELVPDAARSAAGFWRPWRFAAAAVLVLAAATSVYLLYVTGTGAPTLSRAAQLRELDVAPAPYAPVWDELIWRDGSQAEAAFTAAMTPYTRGDWAATEASLTAFLVANPGHGRARFYRGVCLLLLGRADEALAALRGSERPIGMPAGEVDWYLAAALLKTGNLEHAIAPLERVVETSEMRRSEALALRERIRAAIGR
jgi:tetratricopeptide (TPR) repeat protein